MNQVQINGIWWDVENTIINGEQFANFDTANAYAERISRRAPTDEELQALIDSGHEWDEERQGMWFADRKLFLPADVSGFGVYWSSSASTATNAWYLYFDWSYAYLSYDYRAYGFSVRCVSDRKDNWWRKIKRWIMLKIYKWL